MVHLIIGAQWGDEGKGKIVDLLSQKSDCVVRFHGGNNAGHTIVNSLGTFPLHLVPSGIFNTKARVFIGNGVILDLSVLISEINMLKKVLPDFSRRLFISPRCHVIMPYHKILDSLHEEAKGKIKTGTTGRGIGPTYADKVSYNGIRLFDFLDPKRLKERLSVILPLKNKIMVGLGGKPLLFQKMYKEQLEHFSKIRPFIRDTFTPLLRAVTLNKKILGEGAQGMFLDNDWGTYPFVTASSTLPGNINIGAGIPVRHIKKVTGVTKAYVTRVGGGPFPTELTNGIGEKMRKIGHEFGATTGRPRRCGWLDLELLKFSVEINGFTDLAITKLDVLDSFKTLKLCTGYTYRGRKMRYVESDANLLSKAKPIYKEMKGWNTKTSHLKNYKDLPKEAKKYLAEIEKSVGVPASIISVGPDRNQTIIC